MSTTTANPGQTITVGDRHEREMREVSRRERLEVTREDRYELGELNDGKNVELEEEATATTLAPRRASSGRLRSAVADQKDNAGPRKSSKKVAVETTTEERENDCDRSGSLFLLPACSEKVLTKTIDESLACHANGIRILEIAFNRSFSC